MSTRSDALDLEKGIGSNPAPATATSTERAAAADQEDTEPVVTDPRKVRAVNIAIVVFCVVVILIFVGTAYWLLGDGAPFSGEAIACTVVAFLLCAVPLCTVVVLRKDIVSILAEDKS